MSVCHDLSPVRWNSLTLDVWWERLPAVTNIPQSLAASLVSIHWRLLYGEWGMSSQTGTQSLFSHWLCSFWGLCRPSLGSTNVWSEHESRWLTSLVLRWHGSLLPPFHGPELEHVNTLDWKSQENSSNELSNVPSKLKYWSSHSLYLRTWLCLELECLKRWRSYNKPLKVALIQSDWCPCKKGD